MGLFKKIFGDESDAKRGQNTNDKENEPVFYADGEDAAMLEAFRRARESFGYFWRELYWENHRIIPGLDFACVKVAFSQDIGGHTEVEHMWINDIDFDGETISGTLVNEPDAVQNVKNGDRVNAKIDEMSDWMFAAGGRAYGGFSVQAMRSRMQKGELKEHDKAWGLDFGDFNDILVVYEQKEHPENLAEHPMSENMREQFEQYVKENPSIVSDADELGFTQLHYEALAGNLALVNVLLANGADKNIRTKSGKRAIDFAENLGWKDIVKALA